MIDREKIMASAKKAGFFAGKPVVLPDVLIDFLHHYELGAPKVDPEAWREVNRAKQAAGVKFEFKWPISGWRPGSWNFKQGNKEDYREVPPRKRLTAKIIRNNNHLDGIARLRDWEFTGTPEEYRAECEKYGYVVISEITEVEPEKPKTVTHYMAMVFDPSDRKAGICFNTDKADLIEFINQEGCNIIGKIEEREIPA